MVDDQVGADFEMGTPTSVYAVEQAAAVRAECDAQAGAPPVHPFHKTLVHVFPSRTTILGEPG